MYDLYVRLVAKAFRMRQKDVTKVMRFRAKTVLFATFYGTTPVDEAECLATLRTAKAYVLGETNEHPGQNT